jgi:TRAP-type C4-dicarboxylate transport system substrate-binding protein
MWQKVPQIDKEQEGISNKNGIETVKPSKKLIADLEKITEKIRADWLKDAPAEGKKIYSDYMKKVKR